MTFLQLAQRLRRKCRVSGTGPSSVTGTQVEEYARLIDWINEAWMDIQVTREDWLWMRNSITFPTVLNQPIYTLANIGVADYGNWDIETMRNFVTASGMASEITMAYIPYDQWRDRYQFGAVRFSPSRPVEFTITPAMGLGLGPVPVDGYTISADYFRVPSEMSANTDVPALPSQFHMLIVYRAMMYYGASEAAPEVYQEGETEFTKMLARLSLQQLADFELCGALA